MNKTTLALLILACGCAAQTTESDPQPIVVQGPSGSAAMPTAEVTDPTAPDPQPALPPGSSSSSVATEPDSTAASMVPTMSSASVEPVATSAPLQPSDASAHPEAGAQGLTDAGVQSLGSDAARPSDPDAGGMPPSTEPPPVSEPFVQKYITGHSGGTAVNIMTRDGQLLWSIDVPDEANDAWLLPSGNVVFAFKTGAREVTIEKEVVWEYNAQGSGETHTCQPLTDGGFLVAESRAGGNGSALHELDSTGTVRLTIPLTGLASGNPHAQFRQVRKTPQGTYLVGLPNPFRTLEIDGAGEVVRTFPLGRFAAVRLANGNTLISGGDAALKVAEFDRDANIVWELRANSLPGYRLVHVPGIQRLANGNTVVTNWGGHSNGFDEPQILEVTPNKQVIWSVKEIDVLGPVSNVHVVDTADDFGAGALR